MKANSPQPKKKFQKFNKIVRTVKGIVHIKETPLLLGLLVAFVVWGTKHIVDRISATPLVEYRFDWINNDEYEEKYKEERKIQLRTCYSPRYSPRSPLPTKDKNYSYLGIKIKNLSNKLLKNISITFHVPPGSKNAVVGSSLISKSPALKGQDPNIDSCGERFAKMINVAFHPDWEYILLIAFKEREEPEAYLLGADQAIILQKVNLKTRIVRNEYRIVLGSIVIAAILISIYLYNLSKKEGGEDSNLSKNKKEEGEDSR